ncbi:MAG TPA: TatD family hydrolase [Candidatus Binatia bacterium]|nr:TatD family hydrolase [Candidatus Binatia bacterium]
MLIDAHVHLDKYGDLLDDALREIERENIFTIATAMDVPSYQDLQGIARRSALVLPTFGIHPRRAPQYVDRLRELGQYIEMSPAIGEIGLDFHWVKNSSEYPAQLKVLEYFFAAAREQTKIVNLHTKGGEKPILELLERYDVARPIIHWYSGPLDILRALVQFGAYFTVGVEVLYSETIQTIAREIPDRLLLTETDNPGGLKWLKGIVGMPSEIKKVIDQLARIRASTPESMSRMIQANFLKLIEADPWLRQVRTLLSQP